MRGEVTSLLDRFDGWERSTLLAELAGSGRRVAPRSVWFDVEEDVLLARRDLPPWVREGLYGEGRVRRDRHVRLFIGERGQVTGLHYDGNFLDGFVLQVRGRKRWRLLSPERLHHPSPFWVLENNLSADLLAERVAFDHDFIMEPGDALYVPRGWQHHVESLDVQSTSLSMVATPVELGPAPSRTLAAYAEQTALQFRLLAPWLQPFREKRDGFICEDDDGPAWAAHFTGHLSRRALARRFLADVLWHGPRHRRLSAGRRQRAYVAQIGALEGRVATTFSHPGSHAVT